MTKPISEVGSAPDIRYPPCDTKVAWVMLALLIMVGVLAIAINFAAPAIHTVSHPVETSGVEQVITRFPRNA